jgi:hypothetical protein
LSRPRQTWFTYLDMIPGWCMDLRWLPSPVGIRIRDSTWTVQESALDWASALDFLPAMAGVGTTGDTIGITTGESNTTTTPISQIAGRSSIAITSIRVERTSITPVEVWAGMRESMRQGVQRQEHTRAPSAGSTMEGLREAAHSEDSPASAASMQEVVSTEVGASTEVERSTEEEVSTEEGATEEAAGDKFALVHQ